jgi:hypothetical protein
VHQVQDLRREGNGQKQVLLDLKAYTPGSIESISSDRYSTILKWFYEKGALLVFLILPNISDKRPMGPESATPLHAPPIPNRTKQI